MYLKENPSPKTHRSSICSYGIGFTSRKEDLGGLFVTSFVVHPTLSKTKIKLQDLIIAVNHVEVTSKEYNELKSTFWVEGAKPIYTVKRGNKIFEVQTEVKRIL